MPLCVYTRQGRDILLSYVVSTWNRANIIRNKEEEIEIAQMKYILLMYTNLTGGQRTCINGSRSSRQRGYEKIFSHVQRGAWLARDNASRCSSLRWSDVHKTCSACICSRRVRLRPFSFVVLGRYWSWLELKTKWMLAMNGSMARRHRQNIFSPNTSRR